MSRQNKVLSPKEYMCYIWYFQSRKQREISLEWVTGRAGSRVPGWWEITSLLHLHVLLSTENINAKSTYVKQGQGSSDPEYSSQISSRGRWRGEETFRIMGFILRKTVFSVKDQKGNKRPLHMHLWASIKERNLEGASGLSQKCWGKYPNYFPVDFRKRKVPLQLSSTVCLVSCIDLQLRSHSVSGLCGIS